MIATQSDSRVQAICDRVELLAAAWASLSPDGAAATANPRLGPTLALLRRVADHSALRLLARLQESLSRDRVIKALVHGMTESPYVTPHGKMLARALAELEDRIGPEWARQIGPSRALAAERLQPLAEGLAPAEEVSRLCREPIPVTFHLYPSLFLPLPQDGRHGAAVPAGEGGTEVFMFFGFPLTRDPEEFGISRLWLQRGGWHYAARELFGRVASGVAATLAQPPQGRPSASPRRCRPLPEAAWRRSSSTTCPSRSGTACSCSRGWGATPSPWWLWRRASPSSLGSRSRWTAT